MLPRIEEEFRLPLLIFYVFLLELYVLYMPLELLHRRVLITITIADAFQGLDVRY